MAQKRRKKEWKRSQLRDGEWIEKIEWNIKYEAGARDGRARQCYVFFSSIFMALFEKYDL